MAVYPPLPSRPGRATPPLDADAIVVGSGFGGAVAACRLAQAGLDVLVLERGRRYERHDFPALPDDSVLLPDLRRWRWQGDRGLWDVLDLDELVAVQAAGWGGGSLVYANVHLRPPGEVFDGRWPAAYRGGHALEPFYDLAAHMLEVAPVSAHPAFQGTLVKADQLARAARHLGRETFHPPLAIRYADGENVHGVPLRACDRCGNCCAGCTRGAKNGLDVTYLAAAERHGARARTQCEVTRLVELGADGWEVRARDHVTGARLAFRARHVFLCAGAVHSTRLLARSRLGEGAGAARALAGVGYFPGADAVGVVYDTTHAQHPSYGPTITTAVAHWDAERPGAFFVVEDGGYGRQLERLAGVLRAPAWVARNRLSVAGRAPIARSPIPTPPPPAPDPGAGCGTRPPLDALLDAVAQGDFRAVLSEDARRSLSAFVDELQLPLLLPPVVDATLVRLLRARYARSFLLRRLDPDGPLLRLVTRVALWLGHRLLGDGARVGSQALRAALAGGDLPRDEVARRVLGYDAAGAERRAVLLAMGRDAASGVLHYDPRRDRVVADLELLDLAPGYAAEERLMTDLARALGGELRVNPAWAFLGKPITVHGQGGCRMSDAPEHGVTTDAGQVRGCEGLYVLDGAALCGPVGTNPSATILAVAERNVLAFIRRLRGPGWPDGDPSPGALAYQRQREGAAGWARRAREQGWAVGPPRSPPVALASRPLGLAFHEVMQGYYAPGVAAPRGDEAYRRQEAAGCPEYPLRLELDVSAGDLAAFFQDERHRLRLSGTVTLRLPGAGRDREQGCRAEGELELLVPRFKPHAIPDPGRRAAQASATGRPYTARPGDPERSRARAMKYDLSFSDASGLGWRLWGYKRITGGVDAWRATSSLFCQLHGPFPAGQPPRRDRLHGAGVVHVDLTSFLFHQIPSMRVTGTEDPATGAGDPARKAWALARFSSFFFGTLQRIYLPELRAALEAVLRAQLGDVRQHPRLSP